MRHARSTTPSETGMTLVELMVVIGILGTILVAVTSILLSTNRQQSQTVRRAEIQGDSRQALELMTSEIRQAGMDPSNPPAGITGIVAADSTVLHVRADLNGNGVIQTTEPSEDVTYNYDPVQRVVTRDPGSGPATVLSNVTNMRLTYFDNTNLPVTPLPLSATDAARVHSVGLTITCQNRDSQPLTLSTRITLRNL